MLANIEHLTKIHVFALVKPEELEQLVHYTQVRQYQREEIIFHEGDSLPAKLYAIASGRIHIKKTAATGKETILRILYAGNIFAANVLIGDGTAPATVVCEQDCEILTIERDALLEAIRQTPEIALQIMTVLNQRLQLLHNTIHGLVSERAIVRLARFIQCAMLQYGTDISEEGQNLKVNLSYYQISRSIGITYEECVRLVGSLKPVVKYRRGGKITVLDMEALDKIAEGEENIASH
ncbi:cyclic nucleotide-binding protein [Calothrix sp. NIES-4071]|nr:cyclic nucleotide-binding protein [Calothrix sp. NIES-4071]BAZ58288.1 cyclic nucleotide-binding protein [Calothrix sp. NIES-4105]